jgi:hypothetical protein
MLGFQNFRKSGYRFTDSLRGGCRPQFLPERSHTLGSFSSVDYNGTRTTRGSVGAKLATLWRFQDEGHDTYGGLAQNALYAMELMGRPLTAPTGAATP